MTVWTVEGLDFEETQVLGVFSTEARARAFLAPLERRESADPPWLRMGFRLKSYVVDASAV